jgi:hypothetical protein
VHESIVSFAKWLGHTWFGTGIRTTIWGYPFIQLIHFSGLSIWLGTNVAVDLRLLGLGKKRETAAQLSQSLIVWNWIGFCILVLGGFLLFSAGPTAFIANPAFQVKLTMLVPAALVWHIFVQRKTRTWGQSAATPGLAKFAAAIELLLWLSVVAAAVEIPSY